MSTNVCENCGTILQPANQAAGPNASQPYCIPCSAALLNAQLVPAAAPPLDYASPHPQLRVADLYLTMCVCKNDTNIYPSADPYAEPSGKFTDGDLFSIGETVRNAGTKRVSITRLDGSPAFLPADVTVFRIRNAKLSAKTTLYSAASAASPPVDTLKAGAEVVLVDEYKIDKIKFIEIRDSQGRTGYIDGNTKFQVLRARANSARKEIAVGAAICAVGLVITIGTYTAASNSRSGGTYVVAWGPVIFGAIQFFRGLSRLGEVAPPETLLERTIEQIVGEKIQRHVLGLSPIPTDLPVTSSDHVQSLHIILAIFAPYIALPLGIVHLARGRKKSGLAMTITSSIVFLLVLTIILIASKS